MINNKIKYFQVPVEISARHVHLSESDKNILFGVEHDLVKYKNVSQPNQFATVETVEIKGPKNSIKNVRIIAPLREETQVEIAATDTYALGIDMPKVEASGNLNDSSGNLEIIGPAGKIKLTKGVILAQRHLHIEPELALKNNLKHGDVISVLIEGNRSVVFNNVLVRSRKGKDELSFQIDTDEGNAAGIDKNTKGYVIHE